MSNRLERGIIPLKYGVISMSAPATARLAPISGRAFLFPRPEIHRILPQTDAVLSVRGMLSRARIRLDALATKAEPATGPMAETLAFYRMFLKDPELRKALEARVREDRIDPREALEIHFSDYIRALSEKGGYWAERRFDLEDLRNLIRDSAEGLSARDDSPWTEGTVVLTDFLRPTDLLGLDFSLLRAVVAGFGGANSHAAIILKSAGIPLFLLERELGPVCEGDLIRVEPGSGLIRRKGRFWMRLSGNPAVTGEIISGKAAEFGVFPCLNLPEEALSLSLERMDGIGLVRTEIPVLAEKRFFSREELELRYFPLLEHMGGKRVYFRLWDFASDKPAPGIPGKETGTAFLLAHPDLAIPQIEALLTLSMNHPLGITLPRVRDSKEIAAVRGWMKESLSESATVPPLGAMVETLSYANSPEGFGEVDYLIIGANDLLAEILGRPREARGFRPEWFRDPEFLRIVGRIVEKARAAGLPLFLCGEAANDPLAVSALADQGILNFCPGVSCLEIFRR